VPTYAYACRACDHRFEVQQAFTDDPLSECPECSGALRKLFNSVGIVFKGSGFYRTDSRSGSGSSTSPGDSAGGNGKAADTAAKSSDTSSGTSSEKSSTSSSSGTAAKPADKGAA
jgi:putative FmdB family regulatory protein